MGGLKDFLIVKMGTVIVMLLLMGAAGGLTKLSKMPSNNICLLGQSKERRSGFSTATQVPRRDFQQDHFLKY